MSDEPSSSKESSAGSPSKKELETNTLERACKKIVLRDIWSVNDFPVSMTNEVFNRLRPHFQIPKDVPIRKVDKGEKCYMGESCEVGFYEATFIAGLRLPFSYLYHQLVDYMGVSVCQIAPNAFRIFICTKVLWGQLSGGC